MRDLRVQEFIRKVLWMLEEHPAMLNAEWLAKELNQLLREEYDAGYHEGYASGAINPYRGNT
jgi:hypothetical protein